MPRPIRVLFIENPPEAADLILRELRAGDFDPTFKVVDTPSNLIAALDQERWQVIIADHALPNFDIPAVLELLREKGLDLPFIIVADKISEESLIKAIKAGAQNYLPKNDLKRLGLVIEQELKDAAVRRSQKWTEQGKQINEERERAILESALDPIVTVSHDGKITAFNTAASHTFGYKPAAVLGEDWTVVLFAKALRDHFRRGLADFVATGKWDWLGKRIEVRGRRSDDTEFAMEISMNAVKLDGPPMVTATLRDIDDRKKREEELQHSEERVKMLFNGIDDSVFVHAVSGRILDCNEASCQLLGYTRAELLSLQTKDIYAPEFVEGFQEQLAQQVTRGRCGCEAAHLAKDGHHIPVDITLSAIKYQGDAAILSVTHDITQHKLDEEALQRSEAQSRAIFEGAAVGIALLNLDGTIFDSNPALQQLLGFNMQELRGVNFRAIIHPEDADQYISSFQAMVANQQDAYELQQRYVRRDGNVVWGQLAASVVRNIDGSPAFIVAMVEDITKRREAEEEVSRSFKFLVDIIDSFPLGVSIKDAKELRYIVWSRANEKITGLKNEDMLGKNNQDLYPEEAADYFDHKDQDVLNSGQLLDIPEETIQTKHRGKRILHVRKIPIIDSRGKARYLLSISEDVTDLERPGVWG